MLGNPIFFVLYRGLGPNPLSPPPLDLRMVDLIDEKHCVQFEYIQVAWTVIGESSLNFYKREAMTNSRIVSYQANGYL